MFSKSSIFSGLLIAAAVLAGQGWFRAHRPLLDLTPARAVLRYELAALGPIRGPARVAGAWRVSASDPRFGGISALAIDHGRLLALSDAGMLFRLDRPGRPSPRATISALPVVPGPARWKLGRDSEALLRDPRGRGWWVAFEGYPSILLYDPNFKRLVAQHLVSSPRFSSNHGIEALAADGGNVRWIAESSGYSDAAALPDGSTMRLGRRIGLGVHSALVGAGRRIVLPLAWSDNPEALAAEPLPGGGTRLWIMTDNDLVRWRRTLLVAIDLPPSPAPAWR